MENAATTFGKICKKAQTALFFLVATAVALMARQCWRPSISDMMEKWERQQGAQKAHATPLPKMVLEYNVECFLITLCVFRSKGCIGDSQGAYIEGGETAIGAPIDVWCNELVTSLLLLLWRRCLMARINMAGKLSWKFWLFCSQVLMKK